MCAYECTVICVVGQFDNIGLVVGCLPSGSTYVTASPSCHDTAIQDPYLVSYTFYARWLSLYSTFLNSKNLLVSSPFLATQVL